MEARELRDQGVKLYKAGEYRESVEMLHEAMDMLRMKHQASGLPTGKT